MFKNKIPTNRENKLLAQMTTHVVMVIATYRVATIPHDWHTIIRYDPSRSSKVIDFNVIRKPVFDVLLVINSNKPYLAPFS